MSTIFKSYWVDKQYPVDGKNFHFLIGVSQASMLAALQMVSDIYDMKGFTQVIELSKTHWVAYTTDTIYDVRMSDEPPTLPEDAVKSVQDYRFPSQRKSGPDQLTFL